MMNQAYFYKNPALQDRGNIHPVRKYSKRILNLAYVSAMLTAVFCMYQCQSGNQGTDAVPSFNIRFMYFPPNDLADSAAIPQQLVEFAWEEFLALNWQSSYGQNGRRDFPDTTWNYANSKSPYPDTVVWETFAHRSELRPYSNKMLAFDTPPHYSYGTPLLPYPNSGASFSLFNVLDENNEIGSCDLYARVNDYNKQHMVLYQAKVNRDEYEYVLKRYPTKDALTKARLYTANMIDSFNVYYPGVTNSCKCPDDYPGISLPCGSNETGRTGAMEVKNSLAGANPQGRPFKILYP